MKMYFRAIIRNGLREARQGIIESSWNGEITIGCPDLKIHLSCKRFASINKHICFNRCKRKNQKLRDKKSFFKWLATLKNIVGNSWDTVKAGNIFTLDEIRLTKASRKNNGATKNDKKLKPNARECHSVCN